MKFHVGDRVFANGKKTGGKYIKTVNEVGTVKKIYQSSHNNYAVLFDNLQNPESKKGLYWFNGEEITSIKDKTTSANNIPTLSTIINEKHSCAIHTSTKEQLEKLMEDLDMCSAIYKVLYDVYKENTCIYISEGKYHAYQNKSFYETDNYVIYEFEDVYDSNIINKGRINKKKMNKTFEVIKGTRPNTNKGETGYIDTITTIAYTPCGKSYVTCDAFDYDAYTGALVASAKIVAKSNNNASMMYNMAMELWGTDISKSILHALANEAFKGYFDNRYYRWQKTIFYQNRLTEKSTRTCPICGKVSKTIEEKEKHIKWHEECKAHREAKKIEHKERREAQRRIAEMQSEDRIEQYMVEIATKKVNSTTDNAK